VPSYRAIAMAILRNDHCLHSLGFQRKESGLSAGIIRASRPAEMSPQLKLFEGL
jgi:predicted phosphoadenosine phosphosulfate sulfurtransferase